MPQRLLRPFLALRRDAVRLDAADLLLIEVAQTLGVLVALEAEGHVVDPGLQPLVVPLAEQRELVHERVGQQPGVVAAGEGVAVDVEQVARRQGVEHVDVVGDLEVLALGVAVARVTLADVRELDVEVVCQLLHRGRFEVPDGVGWVRDVVVVEHGGGADGLDLLQEALAVLTPPASVAGEAACGAAAPVHGCVLLGPWEV